ncbi:MAG: error-prone DNA polymerase [Gammaproteobacteria bacterium]|nr:error-prone DNA polymerase [Gammaproteobacteria bacterium]
MSSRSATNYAELHCLTSYSFLRGASHPEELVLQAARAGYQALAITDECSMSGVVKAHVAARDCGLKLIIGSEFFLHEDIHLLLLAPNREAYGQICQIITKGRRRSAKGEYEILLKDFERGTEQCLALWIPREKSQDNLHYGEQLKLIFGERLWISMEVFEDGRELDKYRDCFMLSKSLAIPMVASGDVHMHSPDRKPLQDVLSAIRMGQSVKLAGRLLASNREKHLRPLSKLKQIYPVALLEESLHIASLCHFSLSELRYEYPEELVPPGIAPAAYLRQLVEAGAQKRWPTGTPANIAELIEKELALIKELQYEYYFLTVYDIVHFARSQGILCQGRGSAANSVVCFCLEITEVDPARINLLFERFISKERDEPPDIDVDFEHERREEVIQYIYRKYGRHRAALAASVVTYRPRSAIRDVGKALGMDLQLVDHLAKSLSWWDKKEDILDRFEGAGIDPRSQVISQFITLIDQILGFPRHLSQHVGGFVISRGPLSRLVPIENAAMDERTIIQWDKYDIEALGLLKIDVLALGMLTAIRKSFDLINDYRHTQLCLANVPAEDPLTYQMLQRGDSIGVFQVESRAQISMLPRLKPANFYDLVIQVAIVRPGPIQGKMVHPYLKRRAGLEPVTYTNDAVKSVLGRTLGIPIFQEQVIKLAMVAAGFSAGEADQLRRAMAAWKRKGGLEPFERKLIDGMLARGHDKDFAERIFEQIKGFGDYGFPESHAASFALLVYVSAWLKCHEPAAFYCALLNSQPMGFYSPSQLIQDARRHDIEIRPADVLYSDWESTLECPVYQQQVKAHQPALRLGLQRIKGFNEEACQRLVKARNQHTFRNLEEVARHAKLDRGELARLTESGAFKTLAGHRYQTHWEVQGILPPSPLLDKVAEPAATWKPEDPVRLPAPTEADDLRADYSSLGLTLGRHPMAILRGMDVFNNCKTANQLQRLNHGRFVQIAGIVTGRQRPSSASGVIFLTLEDETNNINVVIWQRVLERFRAAVVQGKLLKIKGIMERQNSVIHVIAGHIEDCSSCMAQFSLQSRDFR